MLSCLHSHVVYSGLGCTLLSMGRGSLVGVVVLCWRLRWPLSSINIRSCWRLSSCLLRALPGPMIGVSAGETATWRYWGACSHGCTSRSILTRSKGALTGSLLWGALLSLVIGAWALCNTLNFHHGNFITSIKEFILFLGILLCVECIHQLFVE